jgi:hypothetical protein
MTELRVEVPDEHVAAVYRYVADLLDPEAPPAPPPWTDARAAAAIEALSSLAEVALVQRMAEARGQRVPLSELSTSLGLPGTADVTQDFAGLSAWCAASNRPAMPVQTGGEGTDGWYWMPIAACDVFLRAFASQTPG